MARNSETGHAINVANFDVIIAEITSYGAIYNPSKASLKLAALITLSTNSKNAMNAVSTAVTNERLARNAREAALNH